MELLSEDPTLLAGGLGAVALAALAALRVTQQGKYLIAAAAAVILALAVITVERLWVTDNERIERVVEDIRRSVAASDAEGVIAHLTPDVEYVRGYTVVSGPATRAFIRAALAETHFDFVRVNHLRVNAGRQSRRGTAEFRVLASGTSDVPTATARVGSANTSWSLGFVETGPGVWQVSRITPTEVPTGTPVPSVGADGRVRTRMFNQREPRFDPKRLRKLQRGGDSDDRSRP